MDSPNAMPQDSAPAPQEKASVWEDFLDIFYAPAQVFRRRENGNFWIPLLVVTVLMAVLAYANRNIMRPIFDAEFARNSAAAMRANPQLTQAAMNKMRDLSFGIAQYGAVVTIPIFIVILAFVVWVGVKIFGTKVSWNSALVITSFAMVPRVVQSVVLSVQGLLIDPSNFTSRFSIEIGPGRFIHAAVTSPVLGALMDHLELFTLWGVVLTVIGVAVIGKMSKGKAWAFGVSFWVVTLLPAILGALRTPAA